MRNLLIDSPLWLGANPWKIGEVEGENSPKSKIIVPFFSKILRKFQELGRVSAYDPFYL